MEHKSLTHTFSCAFVAHSWLPLGVSSTWTPMEAYVLRSSALALARPNVSDASSLAVSTSVLSPSSSRWVSLPSPSSSSSSSSVSDSSSLPIHTWPSFGFQDPSECRYQRGVPLYPSSSAGGCRGLRWCRGSGCQGRYWEGRGYGTPRTRRRGRQEMANHISKSCCDVSRSKGGKYRT
ncbi:hypothetical protein B0H21DRAFT_97535 [Amylocystis lapponica]|nr:hypothetical protein B0H21DRAFT_97535 [Amylocystis lapponica]